MVEVVDLELPLLLLRMIISAPTPSSLTFVPPECARFGAACGCAGGGLFLVARPSGGWINHAHAGQLMLAGRRKGRHIVEAGSGGKKVETAFQPFGPVSVGGLHGPQSSNSLASLRVANDMSMLVLLLIGL
jgi:hypothetical protein